MRVSHRTVPALAIALLLSACPSSSGPGASSPEPDPSPATGGTLVVVLGDVGSIDPARANTRNGFAVVAQLFDPLTTFDARDGSVRPAAAESWSVSKDGRTWRFRIADRRYHDGTRVRARDFVFAFDRVARRAIASPAAFQLEQVRGFAAVHDRADADHLTGVEALGRDVLRIRLSRPFAELPVALAHPALAPLPKRYRGATEMLGRRPVGNGPFRIQRAAGGDIVLVPFEDYAGERPSVDRLEIRERSPEDGYRALLAGDVHVAEVPATSALSARTRFGETGATASWATLSFAPNLGRRTYRSPEVRRAISLAIDRAAVAETIFDGTKEPASGYIPRGVRGFEENACGACETDRVRARRIVEAAFGDDPPRIRVDHLRSRAFRRVAEAVAADLRAIGFRARAKGYRTEDYGRLLIEDRHDLAQVGWVADVPTPDGFLVGQLRSGSRDNITGFGDDAFDRLVDRARRTVEGGARLALYREAEARALSLMPLIPVVFFRNRLAVAPGVEGFVLDGAGIFDAARVSLA